MIGADPEVVVDEFCRWFPQGDRRVARQLRAQAEIVNHPLEYKDHVPPDIVEGDRRWSPEKAAAAKTEDSASDASGLSVVARLRRALSKA